MGFLRQILHIYKFEKQWQCGNSYKLQRSYVCENGCCIPPYIKDDNSRQNEIELERWYVGSKIKLN